MFHARLALVCLLVVLAVSVTAAWCNDRGLNLRRERRLEELMVRQGPSLPLTAAYATLTPEQRIALGMQVRALSFAHLSPFVLNPTAVGQLSPFAQEVLKPLIAMCAVHEPEEMLPIIEAADKSRLAPIPLEAFTLSFEFAWATPVPGTEQIRRDILDADRADPERWWQTALETLAFVSHDGTTVSELVFLRQGDEVPPDEVPVDEVKPGPYDFFLKASFVLELPDHVLVNSERLARALNEVSNEGQMTAPLSVRVGETLFTAQSAWELIEGLLATDDYDVVLFDCRTFTNILNYWIEHDGTVIPVRYPIWFVERLNPQAPCSDEVTPENGLYLPANHSEHLLVVYRRGSVEPEAMTSWFANLPHADGEQSIAYRSVIHQRASWNGYRVFYRYSHPLFIRRYVTAARAYMQHGRFVQDRYGLPMANYGIAAVCNDTTGLMSASLLCSPSRTAIWGQMREVALDFYLAPRRSAICLGLHEAENGWKVLRVPSDARPDLTPWTQQRPLLLRRLGASVPTRNPAELHFTDVRDAVETLAQTSAVYRWALNR